MSAIVVRDAIVDDAAAIAAIHVRSWRAAYRGIVPDAKLDAISVVERERGWRERLQAPGEALFVLVGERQRDVAGFCAVAVGEQCEIGALYVDPSVYRCGIGTVLLTEALDRLRAAGAGAVMLWVFAANDGARAFYARFGFQVVEELVGSMGIPVVQLRAALAT